MDRDGFTATAPGFPEPRSGAPPHGESGGAAVLHPVKEAESYPEDLQHAEWPEWRGAPRLGVGLSGGGIRSATLSLGFFQALARRKLLKQIDYLSTVSGGGYFGAYYGHLIERKAADPTVGDAVAQAEAELENPNSPSVRHLRANGRYLSPNGSGDLLLGAAIALRNWVAVIVVMGILAVFLLAAMLWLREQVPGAWLAWVPARSTIGSLILSPSPYFGIVGLILLVFAVPPGWAYWLVPSQKARGWYWEVLGRWAPPVALTSVLVVVGVANEWRVTLLLAVGGLSGLTVLSYLRAEYRPWEWIRRMWAKWFRKNEMSPVDPPPNRASADGASLTRGLLSRRLTRALVAAGIVFGVAVVDTLGSWLADDELRPHGGVLASGYAGLVLAVGWLRRQVAALTARFDANARLPIPLSVMINVGAVVLLLALLGAVAAIPYLILARQGPTTLMWVAVGTGLLVGVIGGVWSFVNRSSLHAVYEARLRRAYLGATNPRRHSEGEGHPPVTDPDPGDGLARAHYQPHLRGGPVHLINVTVNETVDGRSQVQQRDRKGLAMAVGPGGVSVSKHHHALWDTELLPEGRFTRLMRTLGFGSPAPTSVPLAGRFRVFPTVASPEDLDIGQWVAISGAAFSTGLGSRTSLGFSLLAGLFNIRLGYWWQSGVAPGKRDRVARRSITAKGLGALRKVCPLQAALLDEWLARFPGVARREWYLSDGGHFENLGGYELIRRRLPLIIICDHEQDADSEFQGLGNLVRKARIDFDTEITFQDQTGLATTFGKPAGPSDWRHWVGPLDTLRRGGRRREDVQDPVTGDRRVRVTVDRADYALAHAAVARIQYPPVRARGWPAAHGWLLYIKPTMVGDEPVDVAHYHREHPDFPHQSTGDQFFDEAQWESYRRLGELIGGKLFGGTPGTSGFILDDLQAAP